MNYKQMYKEALSRAKDGKPIDEIFPELAESEDEKVRKSIIHLVKKSYEQGGYALHKDESEKMLDYLENQSKKEPVVLKFREGDIIEYKSTQWTVVGIDLDNHCYDLSNDECVGFDTAHYAFKLVEKPAEWSKEDEETLNNILNDLKQDVIPYDEDIQWLNSLKDRYT